MIATIKNGKKKRQHPRVSKEFRDILFELNDAEFANLEADILKRGILHPIIIYNGICIDGMHRLKIAKKHKLPYKIKELHFDNKEDAKEWVFAHQAGKRNQTTFSKIVAGLQFEEYYRQKAKANQRLSPGRGKKGCLKVKQKVDTLATIAKKVGTSRVYVSNTKYILKNGAADTIAKCHRGVLSIRNAFLKAGDEARRRRRTQWSNESVEYANKRGQYINEIICGDVIKTLKKMVKSSEIKEKVTAVITSPPYNSGLNYNGNIEDDNKPYDKYIDWLGEVFALCSRLLRPGGKIFVNCDSVTNRQNQEEMGLRHPIYADLIYKLRDKCPDLLYYDEICWYKYNATGKKSGFGSWCSPKKIYQRRNHEYILIFANKQLELENDNGYDPDITAEEFNKYTFSVWQVHPVTHGNRHPSSYPSKLIEPIIKLYTYPDDIILDCFNGSGTTTAVAAKLNRRYIGIDQNPSYCSHANNRTLKALTSTHGSRSIT